MSWRNKRIVAHAERMILLNAGLIEPRGLKTLRKRLHSLRAQERRLLKLLNPPTKRVQCDCGSCRTCRNRAYMRSWRLRNYAGTLYAVERARGQQILDSLRKRVVNG